ncbi:glycosyl hydrolase family 18 protein [Peribacillus kribbensis]|uniref:glycosyl hydrolase family 18 protein n=1 Tax=Peribacillus kribbensis TaxID=356658 RepID=UPI000417A7CA|nr:glycosyl hydrolase family 18 protein [Peribacillus kribbensis]
MPVYVVKARDNLWDISQKYRVPLSVIMGDNGLASSDIIPGLPLYLRRTELPVRGYIIKTGDTLTSIAMRYETTVSRILAANPGLESKPAAGRIINVPSPKRYSPEVLAFVVPYNPERVLRKLEQIHGNITYLAVTAFTFSEKGHAYAELDDGGIVQRARELGVLPLLMVRNYVNEKFVPELAGRVLGNAAYRRSLSSSLAALAREKGYGGVSIDIEFIPPERRRDFNSFLEELKNALGPLVLQVNVHSKSADLPANRIVGAYDYKAIGAAADITAVMTIDYGYPGGPPDPISPYNWMEEVIHYAARLIYPSKLMAALPLYGYDKTVPGSHTKGLSMLNAQNQAISKKTDILFDPSAQSPHYTYQTTETHSVWYEDIRSYIQKLKLMDAYKLRGTTLWELNLDAPPLWAYLKSRR